MLEVQKIRLVFIWLQHTPPDNRVAHKKPLGKGIIYFSLNQYVSTTILIIAKSKKDIPLLRIYPKNSTPSVAVRHVATAKRHRIETYCNKIVKKVARRGCKFDILFYICTQMWL